MNKLRDFFSSLTALRDWQDEVDRAQKASAQINCSPRVNAAYPNRPYRQTGEPVVIKRDALILDLCAYYFVLRGPCIIRGPCCRWPAAADAPCTGVPRRPDGRR